MSNIKKISTYLFLFFGSFLLLYLVSMFVINPAIDTGRELYIPLRMLNGDVLYKDIFNIYGPLAYQINTFAYWLTGVKVNSLRIFGIINYMLIISSLWFILKEFFTKDKEITIWSKDANKIVICSFVVLTLSSFRIFNYIFPYSFAMTYGLCFFLLSLLFFVKFSKTDLPKFAYLACLFSGCAFCCKYEFTPYLIFLLIYIFLSKNIETKNVIISILLMVLIPVLSFGSLLLQGMTFGDLFKTAQIIKTMAKTNAIQYIYTNFSGTYFNLKIFGFCIGKTLVVAAVGEVLYFSRKFFQTDKILALIVLLFSFIGMIYAGTTGFSLFAIINALLFLIYFKKIYENKPVFIFMLSVILLSLKTFFAVNIESYGAYTLPFLIISIFVFLFNIDFSQSEEVKKSVFDTYSVIVGFFVLLLVFNAVFNLMKNAGGCINTEPNSKPNFANTIYTYPIIAEPLNAALTYIEDNTKPTDKIVVLPETQFLNFVTERPADNLYDSLTPLYFETFGEFNVIEHFEQTKPEYFILNNRDTSDYGKRYLCEDYGVEFCSFVMENYEKVETFGEKQYILQVFKRKDLI